jgi:hypothetical protein
MPTLLSMCTEVLDDIASMETPEYLFLNEDDTARQLIAVAKKVGRELARMKWQQLEKTATVSTVAGTDNYALPSDFRCMIGDTAWNATDSRQMGGQETPQSWAEIVNAPITVSTHHYFRIRGNLLYIKPTPDSVFSFNYEYRSKSYCQSSSGVALTEWTSDDDIPTLPDDLFLAGIAYYFRKGNGLAFSDQEAEYNAIISDNSSTNKPCGAINMSSCVPRRHQRNLNIPEKVTGY